MNPGLRRLSNVITYSSISDDSWRVEQMDIDGERKNSENAFNISRCNPTYMINMTNFLSKQKNRLNRRDWNDHGHDWQSSDDN